MITLLAVAGAGTLALAAASLAVPRVLGWRQELARVRPLTRTVFWTYSAYVFLAHVCFGLLSLVAPGLLADGSPLGRLVSGFIAAWWAGRLVVQFAAYDREARPAGARWVLAEWAMVGAFAANATVYAAAGLR
jgi:hypothetical protein